MSTQTFIADIDADMDFFDKDDNTGSSVLIAALLYIFGGAKIVLTRTIMNFDLSSYAGEGDGSDIVSVKLVVDCSVVGGGVFGVGQQLDFRRCTRPADWVEDEVTWLRYNFANSWTTSGGDKTTTDEVNWIITAGNTIKNIPGFKDLTVDALVNRSNILSIIALLNDETDSGDTRGISHVSREHGSGTKPTLEVTYGEVAGLPERSYPRGHLRGEQRGVI